MKNPFKKAKKDDFPKKEEMLSIEDSRRAVVMMSLSVKQAFEMYCHRLMTVDQFILRMRELSEVCLEKLNDADDRAKKAREAAKKAS